METTTYISAIDASEAADIPGLVKRAVCAAVPGAELKLFGSRARGDHGPESDWDFLVLVDGPGDWSTTEAVYSALYEVILATGAPVCSVVQSKDEWETPYSQATPFHKNVDKDGIAL
ncbi:MAG: nucleotidyltransferase domain-containing protein [Candidatus Hydrogenedens sp.]|nr:nucleotidyltransferase domain-containing protein [Candidatus Hydrogenedens sp.]